MVIGCISRSPGKPKQPESLLIGHSIVIAYFHIQIKVVNLVHLRWLQASRRVANFFTAAVQDEPFA